MLLFGQGFDRRPFGQQQLFGVQRVHGLRQSRFFKAAGTFKKSYCGLLNDVTTPAHRALSSGKLVVAFGAGP